MDAKNKELPVMRKQGIITLMLFCAPAFGSSSFDELGKNPAILKNQFDFSGSRLKVIQKRRLPKKFLSDLSVGVSPVLKGFNYIDNYSIDAGYRFFLNEQWGFQLKYSRYFNPITQEGKEEVEQTGRIPIELKYPQKQSYLGGIEWSPFYGKADLYNRLVRFDLYFSVLAGKVELLNLDSPVPLGYLSVGLVFWLHKHFNSRLEIQGAYYKYDAPDGESVKEIKEYFYKISVSAGVLF